VRLLLEAKAYVEAKEPKYGWTALCGAAGNVHEAMVRLLLEAKVDIDGKDNDGWTALHGAAYGHAEVVRLLLEAKADVEAKESKYEWTALF
jgi:ankyrin repeat protein